MHIMGAIGNMWPDCARDKTDRLVSCVFASRSVQQPATTTVALLSTLFFLLSLRCHVSFSAYEYVICVIRTFRWYFAQNLIANMGRIRYNCGITSHVPSVVKVLRKSNAKTQSKKCSHADFVYRDSFIHNLNHPYPRNSRAYLLRFFFVLFEIVRVNRCARA